MTEDDGGKLAIDYRVKDSRVMHANNVHTRLANVLNVYVDIEYYRFYPCFTHWDMTPFLGAGYNPEDYVLPPMFECGFPLNMFRMFSPAGSTPWRAKDIPAACAELIELMDILADNRENNDSD